LNKKIISNISKPLVLNSEIQNNKLEVVDAENTHSEKLNNISINNQDIVEELYLLFNKKIKKNTLKIIIEQQKEIKKLRIILSEIR